MKMNMLYNSTLALASDRGINEILEMLHSDPRAVDMLTGSEKALLILFVAGLGMAVTFAVLLFLWFCISVLSAVMKAVGSKKAKPAPLEQVKTTKQAVEVAEEEEDEELVAVIAAAVAASLNTSIHNIVVKNIVRVNDHSPAWAKTGRIEQMNTRF